MNHFKQNSQLLLIALLLVVTPALADEVSSRQYAATVAQKKYDLEKSRYDASTALVKDQEKHIQQDKVVLKNRQHEQAQAKANRIKAKVQLDQQEKLLHKAWNKSH